MAYAARSSRLIINMQDGDRLVGRTGYWIAFDNPDPLGEFENNLRTSIGALSDAGLVAYTLAHHRADPALIPAAVPGAYDDLRDKASMVFLDEDGRPVKFDIPAPKATIFVAGGDDVDENDALVADFILDIVAYAVTAAGKAIVAFLHGKRRRKTRKS